MALHALHHPRLSKKYRKLQRWNLRFQQIYGLSGTDFWGVDSWSNRLGGYFTRHGNRRYAEGVVTHMLQSLGAQTQRLGRSLWLLPLETQSHERPSFLYGHLRRRFPLRSMEGERRWIQRLRQRVLRQSMADTIAPADPRGQQQWSEALLLQSGTHHSLPLELAHHDQLALHWTDPSGLLRSPQYLMLLPTLWGRLREEFFRSFPFGTAPSHSNPSGSFASALPMKNSSVQEQTLFRKKTKDFQRKKPQFASVTGKNIFLSGRKTPDDFRNFRVEFPGILSRWLRSSLHQGTPRDWKLEVRKTFFSQPLKAASLGRKNREMWQQSRRQERWKQSPSSRWRGRHWPRRLQGRLFWRSLRRSLRQPRWRQLRNNSEGFLSRPRRRYSRGWHHRNALSRRHRRRPLLRSVEEAPENLRLTVKNWTTLQTPQSAPLNLYYKHRSESRSHRWRTLTPQGLLREENRFQSKLWLKRRSHQPRVHYRVLELSLVDLALLEETGLEPPAERWLLLERHYGAVGYRRVLEDLWGLLTPAVRLLSQVVGHKSSRRTLYRLKGGVSLEDRRKVVFGWLRDLVNKNPQYNHLRRNTLRKPASKKVLLRPLRSRRLTEPFGPRLGAELTMVLTPEEPLLERLEDFDAKAYPLKLSRRHYRWR